MSRAALLIYANKQDVNGAMTAAEITRLLNLTAIKKHKWQIQACCALTGEGWVDFFLFSFKLIYNIDIKIMMQFKTQ